MSKTLIEELLVDTNIPVYRIVGWGYVNGRIIGQVYGNPKFDDSDIIWTSPVIERFNDVVRTKSGTLYKLEKPFGTNKLEDINKETK